MAFKTKNCAICFASFIPQREERFCQNCLSKPHCFVEDDILAAEYLKDARKDLKSTEKIAREDL